MAAIKHRGELILDNGLAQIIDGHVENVLDLCARGVLLVFAQEGYGEDELVDPQQDVHVRLVLLLRVDLLAEHPEQILAVEVPLDEEQFELLQNLLGYVELT